METDEMELDTIGDRKTALFVIISDTDDTFNFVVSILYTQLFNLLCDKRLLTYPRTDSSFLTDDMGGTAAGIIKLLCEKFSFMEGFPLLPLPGTTTDKPFSRHSLSLMFRMP